MSGMRRREFITLLGSAACAWPIAARGQQAERLRRIGALISIAENDPETRLRIAAFEQELQKLGWTDGRSVRIEYRFGAGDADRIRAHAAELVALKPDVIFASGAPTVSALERITSTTPIVFVVVEDPVGSGFVASLTQPGGNITGFSTFEYTIGGKWLGMLKEIAPRVTRAVAILDRQNITSTGNFAALQIAASSIGIPVDALAVRDSVEIEKGIDAVAREPNGALIFLPSPVVTVNRERIVAQVNRQRLPAIYPYAYFAKSGGLISYGIDVVDLYRRAAPYVDRILRGGRELGASGQCVSPRPQRCRVRRGPERRGGVSLGGRSAASRVRTGG
jgi:putative tryptophan/tyrosine transport system substrate-binding protein